MYQLTKKLYLVVDFSTMLLAFSSLAQNAESFTNNSNKTCAYNATESHNSSLKDNSSPMETVDLKHVTSDPLGDYEHQWQCKNFSHSVLL